MKKIKIVLLGIIILGGCLLLTGCTTVTVDNEPKNQGDRFVMISNGEFIDIYYDIETKVQYAVSDGVRNRGTVTMLVDSDGKPLLYKD